MNTKLIAGAIIGLIIGGGGGYYFGTQAGASSAQSAQAQRFAGGNFAGRAGRAGAGAAFGTVVAKDATSITVQLMTATSTTGGSGLPAQAGSKIILFDNSTQIGKTVAGTSNDLTVGQSVVVNGTTNSDGSITAQSIQIRPAGAGPRGGQ